eukprot:scaffold72432_cov56-Phaeocystis_antarctica.AAC.1
MRVGLSPTALTRRAKSIIECVLPQSAKLANEQESRKARFISPGTIGTPGMAGAPEWRERLAGTPGMAGAPCPPARPRPRPRPPTAATEGMAGTAGVSKDSMSRKSFTWMPKPAQPATSELSNGRGAAARDCTGAASHHTVVRASVEASAARDERAGRRQRRRRMRLHGCSLAPHYRVVRASLEAGAAREERAGRRPRRRRLDCTGAASHHTVVRASVKSQRNPRRASRATAEAPPPETVHNEEEAA